MQLSITALQLDPLPDFGESSLYETLYDHYIAEEEELGKALVRRALPSHESFSLEEIFEQSARFHFKQFSQRFRTPSQLKKDGGVEKYLVSYFVDTFLPSCGGFCDLDGSNWDKPSIKIRLANLWDTFSKHQKELIYEKLSSQFLLNITSGTLRVIGYSKEAFSTLERAKSPPLQDK